jgi:hypothetical protein
VDKLHAEIHKSHRRRAKGKPKRTLKPPEGVVAAVGAMLASPGCCDLVVDFGATGFVSWGVTHGDCACHVESTTETAAGLPVHSVVYGADGAFDAIFFGPRLHLNLQTGDIQLLRGASSPREERHADLFLIGGPLRRKLMVGCVFYCTRWVHIPPFGRWWPACSDGGTQ